MRPLIVGCLLALLPVDGTADAAAWCQDAKISGYVKSEYGPRTYDGTSIWTDEPIVAASWNIPIDSMVTIEGLPSAYRVADRGMLGSAGWIDVPVDTRAQAYALTSVRTICVSPP